jgi:E3 ubiquitin-protein ligase HUWE1
LDLEHSHLVGAALHIFEAFMDYSNSASTLFRDLDGLDDIVVKLKLEMVHVEVGSQLNGTET